MQAKLLEPIVTWLHANTCSVSFARALRSHCDGLWIALRSWADRARTFTTVGGGAGTPPSAELQHKHRDLRSRALHEAATEALAGHWAGMRHALVPRRARTQWTDAASERSNAALAALGSPVDVAGSKSVATSGYSARASHFAPSLVYALALVESIAMGVRWP